MDRIKLTCETCHHTYDLEKTSEIPNHVIFMRCNWCPLCEDKAEGYWEEWWDEDDNDDPRKKAPIDDDPNQLVMPFIFDELNISKHEPESSTREDVFL